jgi:hypothetical protein
MRLRLVAVESLACPYCGALVYLDSAERVTYHEAPSCLGWDDFCRETKGKRGEDVSLVELKTKAKA